MRDVYVIKANSSGFNGSNKAEITINDVPVAMGNNENNTDRGMHIVLIDPDSGDVECARIFDTYESSVEFDKFIS